MFGLFGKSPREKLQAEFDRLSQRAFDAQRNGNIRRYSELTAEADAVRQQLDALKAAIDD